MSVTHCSISSYEKERENTLSKYLDFGRVLFYSCRRVLATLTTSRKLVYILYAGSAWAVAGTGVSLRRQIISPKLFFLFWGQPIAYKLRLELLQQRQHIAYCHICHIIFMLATLTSTLKIACDAGINIFYRKQARLQKLILVDFHNILYKIYSVIQTSKKSLIAPKRKTKTLA